MAASPLHTYPTHSVHTAHAHLLHSAGILSFFLDFLLSSLQRGVDFVILAGYMKLVPPELVRAYRRAILNIHPGGNIHSGGNIHPCGQVATLGQHPRCRAWCWPMSQCSHRQARPWLHPRPYALNP